MRSAGGSINVRSAGGVIDAQTSGGSIGIGNGRKDVKVQTAGGNITVKNCQGTLRAATAGGSIEVGDVGARPPWKAPGGGIRLGSAMGKVLARTMSGESARRVSRRESRRAPPRDASRFSSSRRRLGFSESSLETMAGDITVFLPDEMRTTLRAAINSASGHNIHPTSRKSGLTAIAPVTVPKNLCGRQSEWRGRH